MQRSTMTLRSRAMIADQAASLSWPGMVRRADQIGVRCVFMRGGSSRGAFLSAAHLPPDPKLLERLILAIYGSPDFRQIDGLGGANPLTSKVGIVSQSMNPGFDVDFVFGQVRIAEPRVDFAGNCGNLSAAIGPFAIDEGMVAAIEPTTTVRVRLVNTASTLIASVPVHHGSAAVDGDVQVDGVPGTGAGIFLDFGDAADTMGRGLLPTGRTIDRFDFPWGAVDASIVDAANPVVFVRFDSVGLGPADVGGPMPAGAVERMQDVRAAATARLGLAPTIQDAARLSPAIPKVYAVASPQDYTDSQGRLVSGDSINVVGRGLSMGTPHAAYASTSAICTGAAAAIPGTVVSRLAHVQPGQPFRIGHPSGRIEVDVLVGTETATPRLLRAGIMRTARRIMDGTVWVPISRLADAVQY